MGRRVKEPSRKCEKFNPSIAAVHSVLPFHASFLRSSFAPHADRSSGGGGVWCGSGNPLLAQIIATPPRPLYLRHAGGWLDLSRGRIMHVLEVNRRGWPACKTWAWTGPRSAQ